MYVELLAILTEIQEGHCCGVNQEGVVTWDCQ
jgi:hypothetical protein